MKLGDSFQEETSSLITAIVAVIVVAIVITYLKNFLGPPGRLPAGVREQFEAGDEPFRAAHGDGAWPPSPTPPNPNMPVNPSQGIRTITISIPGVLVQENTPEALSEGATVLSEAIAALLAASRQVPDVYLICQVADDIGEAAVRGALEHSRLLGPGSDQIRPQRLLFCETEVGKMSLVRQLEPKVHIDGQHSTVVLLQRFIPKLVEVGDTREKLWGETAEQPQNINAASDLTRALASVGIV